jgi:hypothetical protein
VFVRARALDAAVVPALHVADLGLLAEPCLVPVYGPRLCDACLLAGLCVRVCVCVFVFVFAGHVARGLERIHQRELIHMYVKPENFFLG